MDMLSGTDGAKSDVHACAECGQVFANKGNLTNHQGSPACQAQQAIVAEAAQRMMVGPDFSTLRSDAEHIRKQKILALGRWRYAHKLSHRACEATNAEVENATTLAVEAYARHFTGMLRRNNVDVPPELMQQVQVGVKVLCEAASTSELSASQLESELADIVNPVPVEEPRVVGVDEDGNPMFVVDLKVEKTLEKMLQGEGLVDQALTPHWPQEGYVQEPRDGYVFKQHSLFRNHPGAFAFQLYAGELVLLLHALTLDPLVPLAFLLALSMADDYELLNPIGTAKGKKKLTTVYWRLLNLQGGEWHKTKLIQAPAPAPSPHIRFSKLCVFQIASICLGSTTATAHMTMVVGGDLSNENCPSFGGCMRRFAHGIKLVLPRQDPDRLYFGALLLVSADFPAAGQFCGTKESVSARHFCRHCYISQDNRTQVVNYMKGDLAFCRFRTHESHMADINDVATSTALSSGRGVNPWGTPLCEPYIPHARSIEMVPEDPMHDYLAGQLSAEMHVAFKCFAKSTRHPNFTRVTFNKAWGEWPWMETTSNTAPRPLRSKAFEGDPEEAKSTRLCLTCAQVMQLALVLVPLLTRGDNPLLDLSEVDEVFTSLALHCKVLALCLKDKFSLAEVRHLQVLMLEQHILLKKVHPKLAKRHKFHFTLHIPSQILAFGPPRTYWCMRFEAKHQEIKALLPLLNFVNLPKAVCKLSSMIQGIWVHSHAEVATKSKHVIDDGMGALASASSFNISADCSELSRALWQVCPRHPPFVDLNSVLDLAFVDFNGKRWKPEQDVLFNATGGWEAARITAIWYVKPALTTVLKVAFHGGVFTSPTAIGTHVVNMFSGGTGFVSADEPSLRQVYVMQVSSRSSLGWLIEV